MSEKEVFVFWGNKNYAFFITRTTPERAYAEAHKWFAENDNYFHIENFPPFYRAWGPSSRYTMIDYGSHQHFIYCIPVDKLT